MNQLIKQLIKKTPLYHPLRSLLDLWGEKRWEREGKPIPPPYLIKQLTLKTYAKKFKLKILIETGTYYGDMIEEMKDIFDRIYSIELSDELYEKARLRFKKYEHIELIHGNSGIELENLIHSIQQPALFWLDSHFSSGETAKGDKDTPIYEELEHILNAPDMGHVIIIDDARFFGTDPAYPTIDELCVFVRSKRPEINILVQDDTIRITP
ncbi:hypothetical protein [Geobacter sp. AOG1]|uniref:hypothetical protein n=1 Tax=Geobacter sp. AOG1 TaxID=1566346 RepID=UPI001CC7FA11|nr:hypothetical protein [Geobacter sp. AOG1]GFE57987.1 hypothetical protein AOG1_18670 [Geobacter sp. AOG1]